MLKEKINLFLKLVKEGKYIIERVIARFQLLIGLFYAVAILLSKDPTLRFILTFYSIRSAIIIVAFLFDKVRKDDKYYFAGFKEMNPTVYWRFVVMSTFVLRVPFLRYFPLEPTVNAFHIFGSTIIIGLMLMSLQSQYWVLNVKTNRQKRITYLKQKIHLTDAEFEVIKPILINHAKKLQKIPVSWWVTIAIFSIVLGGTLSSSASSLVDFFLGLLKIGASDLFPPFQ